MFLYSENKYRYVWNIIVAMATGYLAIFIPLYLIFESMDTALFKGVYLVTTLILLADLVLNSFLSQKNDSSQAVSKNLPFQRSVWFLVDLAGAIPFLWFSGSGVLALLQLLKIFRVRYNLVRIRRKEVKHAFRITMVIFGYWVVILTHWLCTGWLSIYGWDESSTISSNYINSLYWTVTTMTSVGYGDIVPITDVQKMFSVFIQVLGVIALGYLIGNMVTLISKRDPVKNKFNENIELLTTTLKHRTLPDSLQKRILDYYNYMRQEKMGYDESAFLQSLPKSLRSDTAIELKMDFIEDIPLFKNAGKKFLSEIALKLQLIVCTPGSFIFKFGDQAKDMYFLVNGEVEVLNEKEEVIATLEDGDFFGEIALIQHKPRTASVRAITYCNLYRLKRDTFEDVITDHREIGKQIEAKFHERDAESAGHV